MTRDGSPVEVYRRLPAMGEPELVHRLAPPGARVLDLGAGTGRVADPLVVLGHDVVAVDDSAEMLAHVRRARPHLGRIEELELGERFEVVLLAGHLVNTPDPQLRGALLAAARRHVTDDGRLLLQWNEPAWFDTLSAGTQLSGPLGPLTSSLQVHELAGGVLTATVTYRDGEDSWTHAFRAARLEIAELAAELRAAGFEPQHPPAPSWLPAAPVHRQR